VNEKVILPCMDAGSPEGRAEPNAAKDRGEDAAEAGTAAAEEAGDSGWLTTDVAAAALNVSPRTVRDYIAAGRLASKTEGSGVQKRHFVSIESLQGLLDLRRRAAEVPRGRREDRASVDAAINAAEGAHLSAADAIRDLVARLEARAGEAADAKARLELTERAESTLRDELARERAERSRAQEEASRLRAELEAERGKGFWRRLFGG
jgi:hypothetical protein